MNHEQMALDTGEEREKKRRLKIMEIKFSVKNLFIYVGRFLGQTLNINYMYNSYVLCVCRLCRIIIIWKVANCYKDFLIGFVKMHCSTFISSYSLLLYFVIVLVFRKISHILYVCMLYANKWHLCPLKCTNAYYWYEHFSFQNRKCIIHIKIWTQTNKH